jgi:5-methylcytosine-specific restriction protein A
VLDGSARCVAHKPVQWLARPEVKRVTGRRLQAMRVALFAREPFCRECAKLGRRVLAKIRDHIKPLAEGGDDGDANIQPLCRSCSDIKTAQESQRGRGHQMSTAPQLETGRVATFLRG